MRRLVSLRQLLEQSESEGTSPDSIFVDPDELAEYLNTRGLALVEHVGIPEYRARYLNPLGCQMNVYDGERVVLARIAGTLSGSSSM